MIGLVAPSFYLMMNRSFYYPELQGCCNRAPSLAAAVALPEQ
jgi:hypothetical protein